MKLPKPFLGRALIEAIEHDVSEYIAEKRGLTEDMKLKELGFQVVEAETIVDEMDKRVKGVPYKIKKSAVPLYKGRIIETAPDWYGETFENRCGTDVGYTPQIGDIVWFVPNETFAIDPEKKYHLINDSDVVAYEKVEETV